jgi:multidrug efflux system outer membrane protein
MTRCWSRAAPGQVGFVGHTGHIGNLGRFGLLAWVACMVCGCAAPMVDPREPSLPAEFLMADAYSARLVPELSMVSWREYFMEPAAQALIEQALAHNPDLRTAVWRVEEARAAFAIQRSESLPTVGLQGLGERARIPADLSGVGRAVIGNQFQLSVGLSSWELDFWGAVRSRNEAALQSYLATDAARRAATLALITQVVDSHLGLRETDERLSLARQTVATREESLRITRRRVDLGAASRLTLMQVQTLLTQAQSLVAQLAQARELQAHALALLVGTALDMPAHPAPLDTTAAAMQPRVGLPSELLLSRPDLMAAEYQLRASQAHVASARAAFFPRVALTGALGTASVELNQLFAPGTQAWSFGPSISLPLFDGGAREASLQVAHARRELAWVAYDKAVQGAFRDVADVLSSRQWLVEQLRIAEAALDAQSERARLSQLRFDNGAAAFLDVLDAQRDLLQAQQQVVQSRRALLSNHVAFYAALGGGSFALPEPTAGAPSAMGPQGLRATP